MDATVSIAEFKKVLTSAKRAVAARGSSLPSLRGVHLTAGNGTLTVTASNLDVTVTQVMPATVRVPGVALVPATDFAKLVKGKGDIALTLDGANLHVVNGFTNMLRVLPTEEWLKVPQVSGKGIKIDLTACSEVAAGASADDARPILCGVLFRGTDIVATDSYRLHLHRVEGADYPAVLIPAKAIVEAARAGDTGTLYVDGDHARIVVGSTTVVARLIDGEFPNYAQLLPSGYPTEAVVDRAAFLKLVDGMKPMCRDATPLRFTVEGDHLVASAVTHDVGQSTGSIPVKVSGDFPTVVAFNPDFLSQAAGTLRGDRLVIRLLDGLKPALFSELRRGGNAIRLLMPVRVSKSGFYQGRGTLIPFPWYHRH